MSRDEIERRLLAIEERGGSVRITENGRDWFSIIASVIGLVINIAAIVWFFGKLDQRVTTLETREALREGQAVDIAVMKTKIDDIKAWVDRQESRNGR